MQDQTQIISDFVQRWTNRSLGEILITILVVIIILIIGRWAARLITAAVVKALQRTELDDTVSNFLRQITYFVLLGVVLLIALSYIGIPTTSIIAIIGAMTLAIGLALQDTLSNFASGILIIFLNLYKVDSLVEINGALGNVRSVGFFHTELRTPDNRILFVPNGDVMDGNIINYSEMEWIRVDLNFGIGYDDNLKQAKEILEEIVASDERITADPPPTITVDGLGDNSVNLGVRSFVKLSDMFTIRTDLIERVKLRFDEAGISFPFPQRDVHLIGAVLSSNGHS